jgi:carbon starvation protein CstA
VELSGLGFFGSAVLSLLGSLAIPAISRTRMRGPVVVVVAVALLALTVSMTVYTFASESYKNDGRTVWEAFDWRHRLLLSAGMVLTAVATALAAAARRRPHLTTWLPMSALLVVFLDYLAVATTLE